MSDLSTDVLHMTSPLRVGRRVGRTIYAQLGPEPSDIDPLVATADSPVLAERIVRAVNEVDGREPDEDERTLHIGDKVHVRWLDESGYHHGHGLVAPADGEAFTVRVELVGPDSRGAMPSLAFDGLVLGEQIERALRAAGVDDDTHDVRALALDVAAHLRRVKLAAPAQPAVAPDTQSAAPTRSVYVHLRPDVEVARTEQVLDVVAIDWSATDGAGEATPVGVEVLGASGVEVDGENVLSGGVADGNGEDEAKTRAELPDPSGQCDVCSAPLYNVCARLDDGGMACSVRCVDLHRLARAAGVSPDSEDVVGEIEAAIRAMRVDTETCCNGCGVCSTWGHLRCWVHDEDGGDRELRMLLCGEPEFAVGPAAGQLPIGSRFVMVDETRRAQVGSKVRVVDGNPDRVYGEENVYRVLYRAPAPAPAPLTTGEVVADAADLDRRATVGTIVESSDGNVAVRLTDGWMIARVRYTGGESLTATWFPVTVVRVGTGGES